MTGSWDGPGIKKSLWPQLHTDPGVDCEDFLDDLQNLTQEENTATTSEWTQWQAANYNTYTEYLGCRAENHFNAAVPNAQGNLQCHYTSSEKGNSQLSSRFSQCNIARGLDLDLSTFPCVCMPSATSPR